MKTKMTLGGIGPKLALITLPYIILATIFQLKNPQFLKLNFLNNSLMEIVGYAWICIGALFYIATIITFLSGLKKGGLITRGTYGLCRNPIYAAFIIFFIPGLALIFESGLIFSIAIVLYINFKISIHGENKVLLRNFGEEYENYSRTVNEILPLPRFNRG
jgi:protein-S-isoprenylcysteine O-methyltransferase Ste14